MKNLSTILIVLIVLSGVGLGVAFFVVKNKEKAPPTPTPKDSSNQPTESESKSLDQPKFPKEMQSNISVPHVDTVNREFEYSLNYLGIPHKGKFKEGVINPFVLRKSFGTFVVRQRAPEMKTVKVPKDKRNKITGNVTNKGGATKGDKMTGNVTNKGGATQFIEVQVRQASNWVDLEIRNKKNYLIHSLAVNLATGAKIGGIHADPDLWDGD